MGPTVWITHRAGSTPPVVATASPTGSPSGSVVARSRRHSARIASPPCPWIAPSPPPPPRTGRVAAVPVDRAVDTTAAEQGAVRRVHHRVDILRGDVALDERDRGHGSHRSRM